ncbi:MAG: tRNA (guanosine(37)-N1)-methyltransferase TrmD [Lachnospiraceae bacterium]|nr:tRNA (guanosine(37)-N1)-methyltransferase TrmD [Lachnospiraceae bacterium]
MKFHILTLFPEMIEQGLNNSIIKRATEAGHVSIHAVNIRDYTLDKHNKVDDYPYGGGAGMLMQAQPVYDAYKTLVKEHEEAGKPTPRVVFMTPQGKTFRQEIAQELAKEEELIFLCGHYEGIDERVLEEIVTDEISIGDYVLTGGELPAMVVIDTVARLIPGVLNNDESANDESFAGNLLEYPQYTRPEVWHEKTVPEVLLSGHHANIAKWRLEQSVERTRVKRPDLYEKYMEELEAYLREHPPKKKRRKKKTVTEELSNGNNTAEE